MWGLVYDELHIQGRSWQSPQLLKTPDHSAVARLKNELQDERRKLQVLLHSLPYVCLYCWLSTAPANWHGVTSYWTPFWQALTKANQQSVDKMAEYKERYRVLKAAMGDKDKQLDLAKRTIERLSGQCNAMEVG